MTRIADSFDHAGVRPNARARLKDGVWYVATRWWEVGLGEGDEAEGKAHRLAEVINTSFDAGHEAALNDMRSLLGFGPIDRGW